VGHALPAPQSPCVMKTRICPPAWGCFGCRRCWGGRRRGARRPSPSSPWGWAAYQGACCASRGVSWCSFPQRPRAALRGGGGGVGKWRVFLAAFLLGAALLLLLPNAAGTFPSFFPSQDF